QRANRSFQICFERTLVQSEQQLPFADILPFFEVHAFDLPIYSRADLHSLERLGIADSAELNRHITLLHLCHYDGHWRTTCVRGCRLRLLLLPTTSYKAACDQNKQPDTTLCRTVAILDCLVLSHRNSASP